MKHILTCSALALAALVSPLNEASARDRDRDGLNDRFERRVVRDIRGDRHRGRDRSRTIYVIERDRPVQRVVYVGPDGRYYRTINGRRVYVRERYYDSYPSRYYYPDGRRRGIGISIFRR